MLSGLLLAAVLALASEESAAEPEVGRREHDRQALAVEGTAPSPEIEALLATHSALHRAAVAHAGHRKQEEALASGRPIHLPVIPKSPPVCSAPVCGAAGVARLSRCCRHELGKVLL